MEQLQELLNLLSKTPEMALWGAGIYFAFVLLKAASWISASAFCLPLAQCFNLPQMLMGQIAQNRCYRLPFFRNDY